jgi:hypothetical protein
MLGIESASAQTAKREAEGKAVGAGCRHAARSVEQCYALNRRADKAAVFAGWREMNDYMRENKLEAMPAEPDASSAARRSTPVKARPPCPRPAAEPAGTGAPARAAGL